MSAENAKFKKYLQDELLKRSKKNPAFSIRSFALQLEVEPSSLAQILSGKRKLTDKMCERLGLKLGVTDLKMKSLMKDPKSPARAFSTHSKLTDDAFTVISDWYYYAILELTHCDGFEGKIGWIAKALDISFAETLAAVERLKRLNYLEVTADGRWVDKLGDSSNLGNEFKAPAFTEHQRQVLKKASQALQTVSYERRIQSSLTVSVSQDKVVEAKAMILNFMEELDQFLKSGQTKDEVYKVSFSLFPVSNISQESPHV